MQSGVQDRKEFVTGATTIAQWPWLAVFDQDIPARVISAVSYGTGFVIISDQSGLGDETAAATDCISAVSVRLREAGFVFAILTAPFCGLAMLHDAISNAMTMQAASGRPLVLAIRHAEALSSATVERLMALAELRHDGQPVLRFLLIGTPGLWSVLRVAGLGHLEDDATAHIRLNRPDVMATPAPTGMPITDVAAPRTPGRPYPYSGGTGSRSGIAGGFEPRGATTRGTTLVRLAILGVGLAGIAAAGWLILAPEHEGHSSSELSAVAIPSPATFPQGTPASGATSSPDARFAALLEKEKNEIADHHLSSPPGDNLIETRRQIDAVLPLVSSQVLHRLIAASAQADADEAKHLAENPPAAMPPMPLPHAIGSATDTLADTIHVTLRYSRGDDAAAARAARVMALLRARGILADGPEPASAVIERSSLAYYFTQDQGAALDLEQRLLPGLPRIHKPVIPHGTPGNVTLLRPGEISISIGSLDDIIEAPAPAGKQT